MCKICDAIVYLANQQAPARARDAEARFWARVFWLREGILAEELMQSFVEMGQTKRDRTKRGIVEIKP